MPLSKREQLAHACARFGFTSLVERLPKRGLLLVLNYHRIGDASATPYDSGVFSVTAEELDWQIGYLKKHFHLCTLDESLTSLNGSGSKSTNVLITFDDGYLDNYQLAFPILRSHAVQGVFFLPTSFVGTNHVAWWDTIAYLLKKAHQSQIKLEYPSALEFDVAELGMARIIQEVLLLCARPAVDTERIIAQLENISRCERPQADAERCYLNWEEAREMENAGMAFGSHTHSHEILTKLSPAKQQQEVEQSRRILQRELGSSIDTLSYPVGLPMCFSEETKTALQRSGYKAAFSFYGGFNIPGQTAAYDICRYPVSTVSPARFRLQTAVGALTGSYWL